MTPLRRTAIALLVGVWAALGARAQSFDWPDTVFARVQAPAIVQGLNAELLASRSATFTLEKWCRDHKLAAADARIVARLAGREFKAPTAEQRRRLEVASDSEVKYRRVQLVCGTRVLSEADNWYVPARLTPEMNTALESTDTPFGRAVQALKPYRQTIAARLLWRPLPENWEMSPIPDAPRSEPRTLAIPDALFEHRAVLYTQDRKPFSEVHEVYQRDLLAFPLPQ